MENKYILMNQGNVNACYIDNGLSEVKESLKDFFLTAFGEPLADGDERLEDTFHYCSQSRFDSINDMNFEQLQHEFDCEFGWTLIPLSQKDKLVELQMAEGFNKEYIEESIETAIKKRERV